MPKFLSKLSQNISRRFETNETCEPPPDLTTIEDHAERIEDVDSNVDVHLATLQAQVEYLLEESGQENKFRTELTDYVKDLRSEVRFTKNARIVFGVVATISALVLIAAPVVLVLWRFRGFRMMPPYPQSALIIAMIAGGVVLLLTMTRSVYRSAHERQNDEFIPPQIKVIHDLMKGGG